METTHYDYIIIGTGQAELLAMKLAPTGKSILIPERVTSFQEKRKLDAIEVLPKVVTVLRKNGTMPMISPRTFHHYCVGGNTKMYGAALLRLREKDFEEVKHAGGTSPAWPIRYSDLEAYHTEAENIFCSWITKQWSDWTSFNGSISLSTCSRWKPVWQNYFQK